MAYVSQEKKAKLAPQIKAICKKYGVSGTLSVSNHSTLVLTIKSGVIDFISNYNDVAGNRLQHSSLGFQKATNSISVNPYWYQEHFDGIAKAFIDEIIPAMKGNEYFDDSDIMTDYFHVSHYFDINIGKWNKPYNLNTGV